MVGDPTRLKGWYKYSCKAMSKVGKSNSLFLRRVWLIGTETAEIFVFFKLLRGQNLRDKINPFHQQLIWAFSLSKERTWTYMILNHWSHQGHFGGAVKENWRLYPKWYLRDSHWAIGVPAKFVKFSLHIAGRQLGGRGADCGLHPSHFPTFSIGTKCMGAKWVQSNKKFKTAYTYECTMDA